MTKIEKDAKKQFLKLSKKEQKRINSLNRIPTVKSGVTFESDKYKRDRNKNWLKEAC